VRLGALAGATVALAATLAPAASAGTADPDIHAHRGGSAVNGKAKYAENTLPAFRAAERRGFVLELDVGVTSDGVPVVLHDNTLERTTSCTGQLATFTIQALAACPNDIVGSPGGSLGGRSSSTTTPIPTLESVLRFARTSGATVNAELKDFDADGSRVRRALDVMAANPLPRGRLIVQSFLPPNLDLARRQLPRAETSRLTLRTTNGDGIAAAKSAGDDWVSPQWPVTSTYVRRAHRAGLKVVPYTLNTRTQVRLAARRGVDALITDDPVAARRWLRPARRGG
jgi:glycerophosphoryl diester phosphodiesterase